MAKPYFILCAWDETAQCWIDEFGDYDRQNVEGDLADAWEGSDMPRNWFRIVQTDGSAADMKAKRDALPAPVLPTRIVRG